MPALDKADEKTGLSTDKTRQQTTSALEDAWQWQTGSSSCAPQAAEPHLEAKVVVIKVAHVDDLAVQPVSVLRGPSAASGQRPASVSTPAHHEPPTEAEQHVLTTHKMAPHTPGRAAYNVCAQLRA